MKTSDASYPLRPRNALELMDVSIQLYKKYFWPLLGCSALVWLIAAFVGYVPLLFVGDFFDSSRLVGGVPLSGIIFFFIIPFLYGTGGYCLDAAIGARQATLRSCLRFASHKYGRMLQALIIAAVTGVLLFLMCCLLLWMCALALTVVADALDFYDAWTSFAFFAFFAVLGFVALFFWGFLCLLPLVACLERKQKNVELRKRCFALSWNGARRLVGLVCIHAVGLFILSLIFIGMSEYAVYFLSIQEFMRGYLSDSNDIYFALTAITSSTAIGIFLSPLFVVTLGTFYVDMRIRREAFDLECALAGRDKMETD